MRGKLRVYLIVASLWPGLQAPAAPAEVLPFRNISIDEGLSQSTVYAITQDARHNLWIATGEGLNRYDSYSFTVYRHNDTEPHSLADNSVRALAFDGGGRLWAGTMSGLSVYMPEADNFHNPPFVFGGKRTPVFALAAADSLHMVAATRGGMAVINTRTLAVDGDLRLKGEDVWALASWNGKVLAGTSRGVFLWDPATGAVTRAGEGVITKRVNALRVIPYSGCWVATEGAGLYFLDNDLHVAGHYRSVAGDGSTLCSDFVRTLCTDYRGRLWVGTFDGLNIFDAATGTFARYTHDPGDPSTLSQNSVRSIFLDNQGGMWLGSYFCGLDYYHPLQNRFGLIRQTTKANSLSDNVISCIVEEPGSGELWIGTNDAGLDVMDRRGDFRHYRRDKIGSDNVKAVLMAADGSVYVGTHGGGMSRIEPRSGQVRNFNFRNTAEMISSNDVYSLLQDNTGIWVGTLGGLRFFDPARAVFSPHPLTEKLPSLLSGPVLCLYRSPAGRIWIGTDAGLYWRETSGLAGRYAPHEGFRPWVNCIFTASDGRTWAGAHDGLYALGDTLAHYTTHDGLPSDMVYGILEDAQGRLWLSTNAGLVCFDTSRGTIRVYTAGDGIQSNQFNTYSYCRTRDGRFFFGGVRGITWFRPDRLMDNPFAPPATITRLRVAGREIAPGDETDILSEPIYDTRGIRLAYDQNFVGLSFSTPNYLSFTKNSFEYMLTGVDREPVLTTQRNISYSGLRPGEYLFRIRAANNDGLWSEHWTELEITVRPPWYATWWAWTLWVLLLGGAAWMVLAYLHERAQGRRRKELEEAKMGFFVNMTHELRTPLTLIFSPLQELLRRGVDDPWQRSRLEFMERSARRLLHTVNQMLDYRRAENGAFDLRVSMRKAGELCNDIYMLFYRNSRSKEIECDFEDLTGGRSYPLDVNYLERILLNLLSNAFKFTPAGGRITLTVGEQNGELFIRVADTGPGIPRAEQERIFEPFHTLAKDHISTGIGLPFVRLLAAGHHGSVTLESEEGHGAAFTVRLPAPASAYPPEEWVRDGVQEELTDLPEGLSSHMPPAAAAPVPQTLVDPSRDTLLLVDDDPEILAYLQEELQPAYNILTAMNGAEALLTLGDQKVDMVVTDSMMPVMDGMKLCRSIKQNIHTSHIPVMMLTARAGVQDQVGGLECGADDYLSKPFRIELLQARIANLLRIRDRLRSHYLSEQAVDPGMVTLNPIDERMLRRTIEVIEANLDNGAFSIGMLCREVGMSRSNLHLKLKAITGQSTIEFIRSIKFRKACELLAGGGYTVAEVSAMLGFSTPSYFATSFRKHTGLLPTEYARQFKR